MILRRVIGRSMLPTLSPGSLIIAFNWPAKVGDIVIARQGNREVVKRIKAVNQQRYYLVGDNTLESTDSRELGMIAKSAILGVMKAHISGVKAVDAPKVKNKQLLIVPYVTSAILLVMLLSQLATFDKFVPILADYNLNGGLMMAQLTAVGVVVSELFTLPFLWRMKLSPLARICSSVLGFVASILWLTLGIIGIAHAKHLASTGIFGSLLHLQSSILLTVIALILLGLVTASFVILRAPSLFKPLKK
jgi:hypothetical protein